MAQTKEQVRKHCIELFQQLVNDFEKDLDKILDSHNIDFDKMPENYIAIYPIVATIVKRQYNWWTKGSMNPATNRYISKMMKTYATSMVYGIPTIHAHKKGDFYECYNIDALRLCYIANITIAEINGIPTMGFPVSSKSHYENLCFKKDYKIIFEE